MKKNLLALIISYCSQQFILDAASNSQTKTKPISVLAMILDYDGCLGAQQQQDLEKTATIIKEKYTHGNYDKLILVSGSNRQTIELDMTNWQINKNGSSFFAFERLNQSLQKKSINSELFKLLTQDIINKKQPGHYWEKAIEAIGEIHSIEYNDQYKNISEQDFHSQWWQEEKSELITNICSSLKMLHPEDKIDFIFSDDKEDLLREVYLNVSIPMETSLSLERGFFWSCYIGQGGGIAETKDSIFVEKQLEKWLNRPENHEERTILKDLGWNGFSFCNKFNIITSYEQKFWPPL